MRPTAVVALALLAPMMAVACSNPRATPAPVHVKITITCNGDSVYAAIFPSTAEVPVNAEVEWTLVGSQQVTAFDIDKKTGKDWPYDATLPYHGNGNAPAHARGMKPGQLGKKFGYSVTATCKPATGADRVIIIDPDMIIIQ